MAVAEGKFKLYSSIEPPLEAGEWRFKADQDLSAAMPETSLSKNDLKVDTENVHVRIRSPRYVLPPDQVLSTYPPANSLGSYGSRLPQVVIKRRTLPWERRVDGAPAGTPWFALVLIAEGEAKLETGVDVDDCVTAGVTLEGVKDVAKGNCLSVRKSVIDKVFPTQNDVDLLVHAREVDIHDTELMMGDDDGFLAVAISNRLPVPGRDENGDPVAVKYLACLVNLEGQFETLLERSPDPTPALSTELMAQTIQLAAAASVDDHRIMGTVGAPGRVRPPEVGGGPVVDTPVRNTSVTNTPATNTPRTAPRASSASLGSQSVKVESATAKAAGAAPSKAHSKWSASDSAELSSTDVSLQMARDFRVLDDIDVQLYDPEYRFPVLLHWSFTTTGETTFRSLMEGLDSRLLGDVGEASTKLAGRLPLEVVESGHVGLGHQTREGDPVRSWYRGPLAPHPTHTSGAQRLPLAHSSDQLRVVIPDGREDLSLATAFETGRLMTLSQPSMIASLMRWRQGHYHAARMKSMLEANRSLWETLVGTDFDWEQLDWRNFDKLGPIVGRFFIDEIVNNPEGFLGNPRPRVTPGRPLDFTNSVNRVLETGLGLEAGTFSGELGAVFDRLREAEVLSEALDISQLGRIDLRETLESELDNQRVDLVSNVLSNKLINDVLTGPAFPVTERSQLVESSDVLDSILDSRFRSGSFRADDTVRPGATNRPGTAPREDDQ